MAPSSFYFHKNQIIALAADIERLDRQSAELAVELALHALAPTKAELVRSWIVWEQPGETARLLYRCAATTPELAVGLNAAADSLMEYAAHLDFEAGRAAVIARVRDAFVGFEDVPAAHKLLHAAEGA